MKLWLRSILAVLAGVGTYFMYIFLPNYLFNLIGEKIDVSELYNVEITLGNLDDLLFYIRAIGFIIISTSFAHTMAAKDTKIKAGWHFIEIFLKITFWGLFIFLDFSTIDVSTVYSVESSLALQIDITVLFWVMMGGNIFNLVITVLDFLIAFFPQKEKESMEGN